MPLEEVFRAAAILVTDPFMVYDLIEESWRPNFLEKVCFKIYGPLINENADFRFK